MQWYFDKTQIDKKTPRPKPRQKSLRPLLVEDELVDEGDRLNRYVPMGHTQGLQVQSEVLG